MILPPAAMAETRDQERQIAEQQEVHSLTELLGVLDHAGEGKEEASVADIHEAIGVRCFGPLLLAAGLIGLTPIGDIPVVPTILAIITILIAGQLLLGLQGFWLPNFIRRRSVRRDRLHKATRFVRPVARGVDWLLRPRLSWLTEGWFRYMRSWLAAFSSRWSCRPSSSRRSPPRRPPSHHPFRPRLDCPGWGPDRPRLRLQCR